MKRITTSFRRLCIASSAQSEALLLGAQRFSHGHQDAAELISAAAIATIAPEVVILGSISGPISGPTRISGHRAEFQVRRELAGTLSFRSDAN
jgi:hypothetical protein